MEQLTPLLSIAPVPFLTASQRDQFLVYPSKCVFIPITFFLYKQKHATCTATLFLAFSSLNLVPFFPQLHGVSLN